jgi:acetylglutamate kinase
MHSSTLVKHKTSSSASSLIERSGPLLIKLGGAAIDQAEQHGALFRALCELHRAANGNGEGVVLIHGGGKAVDRRLERLGLISERRDGIRITPPEHIDEVVAGLAGSVNKQVVGEIQRCGVPAVGLCLGDGFTAKSFKATGYKFDPGRVGEIRGGNPRLIHLLLSAGYMPVLCSIGLDEHGQPLNINADDAAAGLACLLDCRGLVLLTDVAGVLDAQGQVITEMTSQEVEQRIASGEIQGGMIPKVRGAMQVAQASRAPVIITSWHDPAALLRLGDGESVGTRILPGELAASATSVSYAATPWSDLL